MEEGTKVKIFSGKEHEYLGIGTYIGNDGDMPKFILGNDIYLGCDCWWIQLTDAESLEAKYGGKIE